MCPARGALGVALRRPRAARLTVLYTQGSTSLTLILTGNFNVAGFELEPDAFAQEEVTATYYATDLTTVLGTIDLFPNGSSGALLFGASDASNIGKIVINDLAGDDFAIAQLRAGTFVRSEEHT